MSSPTWCVTEMLLEIYKRNRFEQRKYENIVEGQRLRTAHTGPDCVFSGELSKKVMPTCTCTCIMCVYVYVCVSVCMRAYVFVYAHIYRDLESGCAWKHACWDPEDGSLRRAVSGETLVEAPSDADLPTFQFSSPLVHVRTLFFFFSSHRFSISRLQIQNASVCAFKTSPFGKISQKLPTFIEEKCSDNHFVSHGTSILSRWQNDDQQRISQLDLGWTETYCRYLDHLTTIDISLSPEKPSREYHHNVEQRSKLSIRANVEKRGLPSDFECVGDSSRRAR